MIKRPIIKSSHAKISCARILPAKKTKKVRQDIAPRLKRATAKNMRDLALNESYRLHMHPQFENLEIAVVQFCTLFLGVDVNRNTIARYLYAHLRAVSASYEQRIVPKVFTVEDAKREVRIPYDLIASELLRIANEGEILESKHDSQMYRTGTIRHQRDKRKLILRVETDSNGLVHIQEVISEHRSEKRMLELARTPGYIARPAKKFVSVKHDKHVVRA